MASIYTSRQLLDPNWIYRSQEQSRQDYRDRLESLGETAKWFRDWRNRKAEEEKNVQDQNTRRALLGGYSEQGPTEAAVANRFIETGDPSGIMNLENMKAVNKARDEEKTAREAEELGLKKRRYNLAVQDIESETDPSKRIPKLKTAIELGIDAGVDVSYLEAMLKREQEAKGESESDAEKRSTLLDDLKDQAAKLKNEASALNKRDPQAVADFNARRASLQAMIDENGMTKDITVPSEVKYDPKPSRKEVVDALNSGKMGRSEGLKLYPNIKKNKKTRKWE